MEQIRDLIAQHPLHAHLQAFATLFSLVNPFVCAILFTGLTRGQSRAAKIGDATFAMLTVGAVLVIAALIGGPILRVFGISLNAFTVAGGGVLIFIGFGMLQGQSAASAEESEGSASTRLGPLVLFAASPGTITGVITIVAAHDASGPPVTALVAIVLVLLLTLLVLIGTSLRGRRDAPQSLAHDMVSRYMGLIIIAMGIQFALTGYKAFMAG
ncbi:MAG: MarC family protein [Pseudomonadota bacterium]